MEYRTMTSDDKKEPTGVSVYWGPHIDLIDGPINRSSNHCYGDLLLYAPKGAPAVYIAWVEIPGPTEDSCVAGVFVPRKTDKGPEIRSDFIIHMEHTYDLLEFYDKWVERCEKQREAEKI